MDLYSFLSGGPVSTYAAIEAASAAGEARRTRSDAESLAIRLDRTVLAFEALWTLVRERMNITDEQLITRMNEIDLSDGRLDGKVNKGAVSCPKCNRTISRRLPKCIYCGQAIVHDPFS